MSSQGVSWTNKVLLSAAACDIEGYDHSRTTGKVLPIVLESLGIEVEPEVRPPSTALDHILPILCDLEPGARNLNHGPVPALKADFDLPGHLHKRYRRAALQDWSKSVTSSTTSPSDSSFPSRSPPKGLISSGLRLIPSKRLNTVSARFFRYVLAP